MLGSNAITVASHMILILILTTLVVRLLMAEGSGLVQHAWREFHMSVYVMLAAVAIALERAYYVLARFIAHTGVDLWQLHPVPEALSLILGGTLYAIGIPVVRAKLGTWGATARQIGQEFGLLLVLWWLLVRALW